MQGLYDEKISVARDRQKIARQLREHAMASLGGQMIGNRYVINPMGAIQNIMSAFEQRSAREEEENLNREKAGATISALNSMGIQAPDFLAKQAEIPAESPAFLSRVGAFLRGEDQPQDTPAKPYQQNVQQPTDRSAAILNLASANPEMANFVMAQEKAKKEEQRRFAGGSLQGSNLGFLKQNPQSGEYEVLKIGDKTPLPVAADLGLMQQKAGIDVNATQQKALNAPVKVDNPNGTNSYEIMGNVVNGLKNNNFGNIRPIGSSAGFQSYDTPEAGLNALSNQISIYKTKHGINNLVDFGNRFAPEYDENGKKINDTKAWIKNVAIASGLSPNETYDFSDPEINKRMTKGIITAEQGQKVADSVFGNNAPKQFGQTNEQKSAAKIAEHQAMNPANIPAEQINSQASNLALLEKLRKAKELVEANKNAFGVKNYLPDFITQRIDKEGITPRAAVAEIGSQKISDISGANVPMHEMERLRPFIPTATDDSATISKKLNQMESVIKDTENSRAEMFNNGKYKQGLIKSLKDTSQPKQPSVSNW